MRYCEYCGAQQDDDALFCTQCGQRLSPLDI
ncbi:MAG: zinc-ribbon domain-containing protein, partial [Prevotella sp.]|nr:zinc-ribbon domain-containing protein [Prevotella sp.]